MVQKYISIKEGKIVIDFPAYTEEEDFRAFCLECLWSSYEYLND